MVGVNWPSAPSCHNGDPVALMYKNRTGFDVRWRESDTDRPFRHCSFCGSIHPEDLIKGLKAGARAELSDMKYGWPHKHYIDGIPNPFVGQPTRVGSASLGIGEDGKPREPTDADRKHYSDWHLNSNGVWEGHMIRPAAPTLRAKWYNAHLQDFDLDSFKTFEAMIRPYMRIEWNRTLDGRLGWRRV